MRENMGKKTIFVRTLGLLGLGVVCFGGISSAAMAADLAMVKEKCAGCHGADGNSKFGKVPNIAGFSTTALTDMLNEYKSKDRVSDKFKPEGGDETDMNAITKDMSDADIAVYAKYYSGQKFAGHKGKADAALAERGAKLHDRKCEKCHSDGATNPEDDASLLAGQHREYLVRAFEKLASGDQPMPRKMKKKFKKLKPKHIKELIEYYVSGGGAK